jgi:hypothetical protein
MQTAHMTSGWLKRTILTLRIKQSLQSVTATTVRRRISALEESSKIGVSPSRQSYVRT